jgi:hypothetical protein
VIFDQQFDRDQTLAGQRAGSTLDGKIKWPRVNRERQQFMLASTDPREIAKLNVAHYRKLLQSPLDEERRQIVEKLLAEELNKLAKHWSEEFGVRVHSSSNKL